MVSSELTKISIFQGQQIRRVFMKMNGGFQSLMLLPFLLIVKNLVIIGIR